MACTLLLAVASPGVALAAPVPDHIAPTDPRRDLVESLERARTTGEPVEIVTATTETSRTWANPDGSFTSEFHAGPERIEDGEGGWETIDTTLQVERDGLQAAAAPAEVAFSRGGDGPVAEFDDGEGHGFDLTWTGLSLPAPEVDGNVARYRNVKKGIDLELEMLPTGYAKRIILNERPTKPLVWRFPLKSRGLTARTTADGSIELVDKDGEVVAAFDGLWMWGAQRDPASGEPTRVAEVQARLLGSKGQVLEVRPDPAFLADPTVELPITIDPTVSLTVSGDTFVQSNISSTSQWSATELKVGTYDGGSTKARSLIRFNVSSLAGKKITDADMYLYNFHSWSCTAKTMNVRRLSSGFSSSTVWSNQPSAPSTVYGSKNFASGYSSSCPDAWQPIDVTGRAQAWADGEANNGLLLIAASETDNYGWKKFNSSEASSGRPYLKVTYNSYPATVSGRNHTPAHYIKDGIHYLASLTPTLHGGFSDPDAGATGKVVFEVYNDAKTSLVATVNGSSGTSWYASKGAVPSGKLTNGTRYQWRARGYDGALYSKAYSTWIRIAPDVTGPSAPTVSSSSHPSQSTWYANKTVAVSWPAASDPSSGSGTADYGMALNSSSTTQPTSGWTTTRSGTLTTTGSGTWWVHVRGRDNVLNLGSTTHYKVNVDVTAPGGVGTMTSSSHPDTDAWYRDAALSASWSGATDAHSGISGYVVKLDGSPTTQPTSGTTVTGTSWSGTAPSNGIWYLHVRAKDKAGNLGATSHYKFNIGVFNAVEAYGLQPFTTWAADVNAPFGNFVESATDVEVDVAGPDLEVARTYNSRSNLIGAFGRGWTFNYGMYAEADAQGNVLILYPDGRRAVFAKQADGTLQPPTGFFADVTRPSGGFLVTEKDDTAYRFDSAGRLTSVTDSAGRTQTLTYDGSGRLSQVTDTASGRHLQFGWTNGKITTVSTSSLAAHGGPLTWAYDYDGDDLASVCDPRSTTSQPRCVTYTTTAERISDIRLPAGNRKVAVDYAPDGLVRSTTDGEGNTTSFDHPAAGVVNITDPRGNLLVVHYDTERRTVAELFYGDDPQIVDGQVNTDVPTASHTYDSNGFPASTTDPNGVTVETEHDARGNLTKETCVGCAGDDADERDEVTWFTYDADDNLIETRDARSTDGTDDRYLTRTEWHTSGEMLRQTSPPVDGHPSGIVRFERTFTTGAEPAVGGGTTPPGLVATETDARGNVTTFAYTRAGDVARETSPSGMVTEYGYDELGRETSRTETFDGQTAVTTSSHDVLGNLLVETGPLVTNAVTGTDHQLETSFLYNANGSVLTRTERDIAPGAAPTAARVTTFGYDDNDREVDVLDPESGRMTREYDPAGNVEIVTDAAGRVLRTVYDDRNRAIEVWQDNYDDPTDLDPPAPLRLSATTYDDGSRIATTTDGEGRVTAYTYDGRDRIVTATLRDYLAADDTVRDVVLRHVTYDLAGNPVREELGDGGRTTTSVWDAAGRLVETIADPDGLAVVTTMTHDADDNPLTVTTTHAGRTEQTRTTYTVDGNPQTVIVENGDQDLTTHHTYDQRGLLVSTTGPRGSGAGDPAHTTTMDRDLAGRVTVTSAPPVQVEQDGQAPAAARPTATTGYDAFGNATHVRDPRGHVTVTEHDRLNRPTRITHPTYARPDGQDLTPVETFAYDAVGNLLSRTTRRGAVHTNLFDTLNRPVRQTTPPAADGGTAAVTETAYDTVGNVVAVVDATGARTETDRDMLDQPRVLRQFVRDPGGGPTRTLTTLVDHDPLGQLVRQVDPTGATTTHAYDALGRRTSTTDAAGQVWTSEHDLAGRTVATTDPLGRRVESTHDLAGRTTAVTERAVDGTILAVTRTGHDADGNVVSRTDPRDVTTTWDYDALGRLLGTTVPVTAGTSITTSYGYDAAGNLTRMTDGRGNTWTQTFTPWNQVATSTEPATAATPDVPQRTWTTLYDAGGLPVEDRQPGDVTVTRGYDLRGQLRTETGVQGGVTADRSFTYDQVGRRTGFNHPGGTQHETYDDRGLLVATTGPAGNATFAYDDAGRMTARTDVTGTASFSWTARGELDVMVEPLTGRAMDHDWDPAGQLDRVVHDDGTTQQFVFDERGRLASEAWSDFAGEVYAEEYGYDAASNPTGRLVRRRGAAPQAHSYGYDLAGRLTSWTDPDGTTVAYGWDASSNRTADGAGSWTYDQRNRLVSGPEGTYQWTERGTLASLTGPSGTATWTFDPLGRATSHTPAAGGPVQFAYDGLDRIATRDSDAFVYSGPLWDPASDGVGQFSRTPAGHLVATSEPTAGATRTITDRHGDVVGAVDATGNVVGVRAYSPFGQVATTDGTIGTAAGFQGDWTDPTSGEVWQGARWYQPAWATFTSRDTVFGELATPMSLNRFTYAFGSPLRFFDPDGRYGFDGTYAGSKATYSTYKRDHGNYTRAKTKATTYKKVSTNRALSHEFEATRAAKAKAAAARTRAAPKTVSKPAARVPLVAYTARTNSVKSKAAVKAPTRAPTTVASRPPKSGPGIWDSAVRKSRSSDERAERASLVSNGANALSSAGRALVDDAEAALSRLRHAHRELLASVAATPSFLARQSARLSTIPGRASLALQRGVVRGQRVLGGSLRLGGRGLGVLGSALTVYAEVNELDGTGRRQPVGQALIESAVTIGGATAGAGLGGLGGFAVGGPWGGAIGAVAGGLVGGFVGDYVGERYGSLAYRQVSDPRSEFVRMQCASCSWMQIEVGK